MIYTISRIIASGMLFMALGHHPYSYYTTLRVVVCAVAAYGVYFASECKDESWKWVMVGMAVLFNPIVPIHLDRTAWNVIDVIAGGVLIVSIVKLKVLSDVQ